MVIIIFHVHVQNLFPAADFAGNPETSQASFTAPKQRFSRLPNKETLNPLCSRISSISGAEF
jgi:hypothetical protein